VIVFTRDIAVLLGAFALGITIGNTIPYALNILYLLLFLSASLVSVAFFTGQSTMYKWAILLLFLSGGILALLFTAPVHTAFVDQYVGVRHHLTLQVDTQPDKRISRTSYVAEIKEIDGKKVPDAKRIKFSLPKYPEYRPGDTLSLHGIIQFPEDF
jgi:hypothetical protein